MDQPVSGRFAMALTKVVPAPLREVDYMIIGSVSALAGLLAGEVKPKPRRHDSTSILDQNGGSDNSDPRP